jgi:hypothetical protein
MDKPHKRLLAWKRSMDLVVRVYELTKGFSKEEVYGLTAQLRRAAVSVPKLPQLTAHCLPLTADFLCVTA